MEEGSEKSEPDYLSKLITELKPAAELHKVLKAVAKASKRLPQPYQDQLRTDAARQLGSTALHILGETKDTVEKLYQKHQS